MTTYLVEQNDRNGDIVDQFWFGSERNAFLWLEKRGVTFYSEIGRTELADGTSYEYGNWPGGQETDHDVYDAWDGELLWLDYHWERDEWNNWQPVDNDRDVDWDDARLINRDFDSLTERFVELSAEQAVELALRVRREGEAFFVHDEHIWRLSPSTIEGSAAIWAKPVTHA